MKKLVMLFALTTLGVCLGVSAKGWHHKYPKYDMGDCPIPCCEKQETITIRKPAEMCCGYVCPDDTVEVENNEK